MSISESVCRIARGVGSLQRLDLGYTIGDNRVLPADSITAVESRLSELGLSENLLLRELYLTCGGISLPDVHVGYFIETLPRLGGRKSVYEICEVRGSFPGKVLTFGSTGGGDAFALRLQELDVLILPPGPVTSNLYDGSLSKIKRVAADLTLFLERLASDVEAFICDSPDHEFLA